MRKVIRGYAKDKNPNLILIGTIPVPHSKDKCSPAACQAKRYLVRQGATIFKKETYEVEAVSASCGTLFLREVLREVQKAPRQTSDAGSIML
jgi:hypothetical protein